MSEELRSPWADNYDSPKLKARHRERLLRRIERMARIVESLPATPGPLLVMLAFQIMDSVTAMSPEYVAKEQVRRTVQHLRASAGLCIYCEADIPNEKCFMPWCGTCDASIEKEGETEQ